MLIKFTRHALEKFEVLARHGFVVTRDQIVAALLTPDKVETERDPPIAQKQLDDRHVLRIVFRVEGDDLVVVTFYPGRRRQYED